LIGINRKAEMNMKMNTIIFGITMMLLLALPAAASDFTLGVFGNANEDDTINMQDVTYTELIILEYRDQTELSDAKYDGKINMQDVTQIELVILGKEKELTILDSADRTVTVEKPVERIIPCMPPIAEAIQVLDAVDEVVGVSYILTGEYKKADKSRSFPILSKLPSVGGHPVDYEAVLSLNPDVVIEYVHKRPDELQEHLPGVPVVGLSFIDNHLMKEEIQKLGYILDKEAEAEEYIEWYERHFNTIKDRIDTLSDDEKPRIYYGGDSNFYKTRTNGGRLLLGVMAGGRNIAADLPGASRYGSITVDPEWVIGQNPDIILVTAWAGVNGAYATDDPSGMKEVWDSVMNRPELANVAAVKNGKVFVGHYDVELTPSCVAALAYLAKQLHPDLFDDLDPQAIHQEYVDQFKRIDFDVYEDGVFVYPPLES
jgi:iron complex transport system substrate-binding protein